MSDWKTKLDFENTNKGLRLKNTIDNAVVMIAEHDSLRGALRYNEFAEREEVQNPPWDPAATRELRDTDITSLRRWFETCEKDLRLNIKKSEMESIVSLVARANRYHPVREHLTALSWDGRCRLRDWAHTYLGLDPNEKTAGEFATRW